ncbi:hypothetical protein K426_10190 [Sphingobium sp. TKS]|nr:hypothetical protein K426_10190 [Sphingobium sp. TKS]
METDGILLRSAVADIRQDEQPGSWNQARKPLAMLAGDELFVLAIGDNRPGFDAPKLARGKVRLLLKKLPELRPQDGKAIRIIHNGRSPPDPGC